MRNLILVLFSISLLLAQGCATSLYSEEESYFSEGSEDYIVELLNDATTTESYTTIINYAQSIIDDENATSSNVASAYTYMGEALLGSEGVNLISILEDVSELESMSQDDLESGNIFDLISIDASADTLKAAADAFSSAASIESALQSSRVLKNTESTFEMSKDQRILAGFANTLYVIQAIQLYYDIDSSGSVTLINESDTYATISASLIGTYAIHTYAASGFSHFEVTESFTTEQLEILEKVTTALTSYSEGWAAYDANTSYTYKQQVYDFSVSGTKDTVLEQFIDAIFQEASS